MNGFWKRKLPAFLLAMAILVSLSPAALSEEDWKYDDKEHWLVDPAYPNERNLVG